MTHEPTQEPAYEPSPLADVDCRPSGDRWQLIFVRDLKHPPEKVWAALTTPENLEKWAPYTADRDLGETGEATLTMIDGDTQMDMKAEVLLAEPGKVLEYSMGTDLLRWQLEPSSAGTQLTLLHTVQDKDWVPKVAAGWHMCLDVAEKLLDGTPIAPIRGADAVNYGWLDLNSAYADRLSIEDTGLPGHLSE
ncbi:SRPBCC family protein [Actinocrispum sp. NPDC049592]|uniref:SRPBCC family protein n=1 Tax=Actinocrispum sp. NPDC049592 TaxID=3154835 RepID=UPI003423DFC5